MAIYSSMKLPQYGTQFYKQAFFITKVAWRRFAGVAIPTFLTSQHYFDIKDIFVSSLGPLNSQKQAIVRLYDDKVFLEKLLPVL